MGGGKADMSLLQCLLPAQDPQLRSRVSPLQFLPSDGRGRWTSRQGAEECVGRAERWMNVVVWLVGLASGIPDGGVADCRSAVRDVRWGGRGVVATGAVERKLGWGR